MWGGRRRWRRWCRGGGRGEGRKGGRERGGIEKGEAAKTKTKRELQKK